MSGCQLNLIASALMGIDLNVLLRKVTVMDVSLRFGVFTTVHAQAGISLRVAHDPKILYEG